MIDINEGTHDIKERLKSFQHTLKAKKAGKAINIGNADGFLTWLRKVRHLYSVDKGKPNRRIEKIIEKGVLI